MSITLLTTRAMDIKGREPTHSIDETLSFSLAAVLCIFVKVFGHLAAYLESHL